MNNKNSIKYFRQALATTSKPGKAHTKRNVALRQHISWIKAMLEALINDPKLTF